MNEYHGNNFLKIYNKSCVSMSEIDDETVQCVITSPPYWGLRKYDGPQELVWSGDPECDHEWITEEYIHEIRTGKGLAKWSSDNARGGGKKIASITSESFTIGRCKKCDAWRGAFGLEPTPEMYVEHTISILREIHRVLKKDGVVFWNIGDTYAGSWGSMSHSIDGKAKKQGTNVRPPQSFIKGKRISRGSGRWGGGNMPASGYMKPKDLCLIPARVAIAAQKDGWWVRSDIIWNKTNPMPESVKDRPSRAHEHILVLTKSAKYYWNIDAIRVKYDAPLNRWGGDTVRKSSHKYIENGGHDGKQRYGATSMYRMGRPVRPDNNGRNIRDIWMFPTCPYPGTHFATFPEELPKICVKAASREGDIILDPFAGTGTALWVAEKLGRKAIGYELSEKYCQMILERCRQQVLV